MPYAIIKMDTEEIVTRHGELPRAFEVVIDGHRRRIVSPTQVGDTGLGYKLVNLVEVNFAKPGPYFTQGADTKSPLVGNDLTITRNWTAWTQAEINAYETTKKDEVVAQQYDDVNNVVLAAVLVILDEFNRHTTVEKAIFDAAAAATSLADFKTRMAAIAQIPQRTPAQIRTSIRSKLDEL